MQIILKKKVKSKSKPKSSNNMAGKKRGSKRKSSSRTTGVFSGKILGQEVPVLSKIIKNKTFQKAAAGAGLVSIALTIAQLLNNPTVNKALSRKEVRIALAAAGGDITGAAAQFAKEGGLKQFTNGGNGTAQTSSQVGFA